jgi:DNA-binding transcriptional regulator/RsmH inhibitor MraZ
MRSNVTRCGRESSGLADITMSFLGNVEVGVEQPSGRISIPSIWKPHFGRTALLLAGENMGLDGHLMFSEETFRAFLERRKSQDLVKALMHVAEPRYIDKQSRLCLPASMVAGASERVTLLGEGDKIVILPSVAGGMALAEDLEVLRAEEL